MPNTRSTDPQTSFDAADSISSSSISETKKLILLYLTRPMTDERLVNAFRFHSRVNASESGIRSRRAELVDAGLVVDTGERQKMTSGRMAIVWKRAESV